MPARIFGRLRRHASLPLTVASVGLVLSATVFAVLIDDVLESNGLTRQDGGRLGWFLHHRPEWLVTTTTWLTTAGSVPVLLVLGLGAGLFLYKQGKGLLVAATPTLALLVAGALTAVLKQLVGRARPPLGMRLLAESQPSFPSGHATDSTALFVSLALVVAVVIVRRPVLKVFSVAAAFGIAGVIGLTRLVLGVHWPTDVVAGWALGTAVALVVTGACLGVARLNLLAPGSIHVPDAG